MDDENEEADWRLLESKKWPYCVEYSSIHKSAMIGSSGTADSGCTGKWQGGRSFSSVRTGIQVLKLHLRRHKTWGK